MTIARGKMAQEHSIAQARRNLPGLIREAELGMTVQLTRRGKPVAVLVGHRSVERMVTGRRSFVEAYDEDALNEGAFEATPIAQFGIRAGRGTAGSPSSLIPADGRTRNRKSSNPGGSCLCQEFLHDPPADVGQPEVSSHVPIGESLVIKPHQMQERRLKVMDMHRILDNVQA